MSADHAIAHAHITKTPGFAGGRAAIRGTRFSVRSVVEYVLHLAVTPEELVRNFPHITLAQVYDALSYYYDNQEEIDKEITENTEEYWRARLG